MTRERSQPWRSVAEAHFGHARQILHSRLGLAGVSWRNMPHDTDRAEAKRVVAELRRGAARLIRRSKEFAEESLRMKQRADDLDQIINQRDARKK